MKYQAESDKIRQALRKGTLTLVLDPENLWMNPKKGKGNGFSNNTSSYHTGCGFGDGFDDGFGDLDLSASTGFDLGGGFELGLEAHYIITDDNINDQDEFWAGITLSTSL